MLSRTLSQWTILQSLHKNQLKEKQPPVRGLKLLQGTAVKQAEKCTKNKGGNHLMN